MARVMELTGGARRRPHRRGRLRRQHGARRCRAEAKRHDRLLFVEQRSAACPALLRLPVEGCEPALHPGFRHSRRGAARGRGAAGEARRCRQTLDCRSPKPIRSPKSRRPISTSSAAAISATSSSSFEAPMNLARSTMLQSARTAHGTRSDPGSADLRSRLAGDHPRRHRAAQSEMEALLERTAISAFIREKKDFYTALFDDERRDGGRLDGADLRRHDEPGLRALPAPTR